MALMAGISSEKIVEETGAVPIQVATAVAFCTGIWQVGIKHEAETLSASDLVWIATPAVHSLLLFSPFGFGIHYR